MDIDSYLRKPVSEVDPKAGNLLISEPMLPDFNFARSAVLILDRNAADGHLGLVMNRELDLTLDKLLPDWKGAERINLFLGGPVEYDRLFVLHRLGDVVKDSVEIIPGLWLGGDFDAIREYIASGEGLAGMIRFYLGYAGWDKGQLTAEIINNSWGVNPAPSTEDLLVGTGTEYWDREVRRLGPLYHSWLNIPQHSGLN